MSCPVCGTSTTPGQTFCGACGTKLALMSASQQSSICPTCASPVKQGQQFCGVCGATITGESQQQQWNTQTQMQAQPQQQPAATQPMTGVAPDVAVVSPAPRSQEIASQANPLPTKKHGMLLVTVAMLQIIGWVVVVGGCIGAIMFAMSDIGTDVLSKLPITGGAGAIGMIIKFTIGLVVSSGYGFGLLAFAELCKLLMSIEGNTMHKEDNKK